jgi:hypothetical protein
MLSYSKWSVDFLIQQCWPVRYFGFFIWMHFFISPKISEIICEISSLWCVKLVSNSQLINSCEISNPLNHFWSYLMTKCSQFLAVVKIQGVWMPPWAYRNSKHASYECLLFNQWYSISLFYFYVVYTVFSAEFTYYVSCTLVFSYGEFLSVICQFSRLRTKWIWALWGPEEAQLAIASSNNFGCTPGSCYGYSYFFQDN